MTINILVSYLPVFFAAVFLSTSLSVRGHFLVTKGEGPMILALSQLAIAGHLLGKGIIFHENENFFIELIPSVFAYFLGLLFFINKKMKDISFIAIFIILMAINYQVISLIPKLDSHLSANLFGDITTISNLHAYAVVVLSILFLTTFYHNKKKYLKDLIDDVHYGSGTNLQSLFFYSIGHILLFVSLFEMGFLFTLAYLLLPTLFLSSSMKSFQTILRYGVLLSILSSGIGLLITLHWSRLSTMPTQIILLLALIIFLNFASTKLKDLPWKIF